MAVNPGGTKSDEIIVYQCIRESRCSECGREIGLADLLRIEAGNHLCLVCSKLDHLVYLHRGNTALTRRARKHSPLHAVVVRASSSGKSNKRQGILIDEAALQLAERECLSEEDVRVRAHERLAKRRARLDIKYVKKFAEQISGRYPSCPRSESRVIAERAFKKYPGMVDRSETVKRFDPEIIDLAVVDHIRQEHTEYDLLLGQGWSREKARSAVEAEVEGILNYWRIEIPDIDFSDFIEFDVFSPDKLGIFEQLFHDHEIDADTEPLVAHLVLVLHEVLRGPDRRAKKSSVEIKDPEKLWEARLELWLKKLEDILTDPPFMKFLELNQIDLEKKKNQLEADLAESKSLKRHRGGKAKTLIPLLVPVVVILDKNGLNPAKRALFLRQLFRAFGSPEFGVDKNLKKEIGGIRAWDKAASKIANSMSQDLKNWTVDASLSQLTREMFKKRKGSENSIDELKTILSDS